MRFDTPADPPFDDGDFDDGYLDDHDGYLFTHPDRTTVPWRWPWRTIRPVHAAAIAATAILAGILIGHLTATPQTTPPATTPPATTTPAATPTSLTPADTTTTSTPATTTPRTSIGPVPPPAATTGLYILGDSLSVGTDPALTQLTDTAALTYTNLAAAGLPAGATARQLVDLTPPQPGVAVIVALGTNNPVTNPAAFAAEIDRTMTVLTATTDTVWWLTIERRDPRTPTLNTADALNTELHLATYRWPELRIADWSGFTQAARMGSLDGVHLDPAGYRTRASYLFTTGVTAATPTQLTAIWAATPDATSYDLVYIGTTTAGTSVGPVAITGLRVPWATINQLPAGTYRYQTRWRTTTSTGPWTFADPVRVSALDPAAAPTPRPPTIPPTPSGPTTTTTTVAAVTTSTSPTSTTTSTTTPATSTTTSTTTPATSTTTSTTTPSTTTTSTPPADTAPTTGA